MNKVLYHMYKINKKTSTLHCSIVKYLGSALPRFMRALQQIEQTAFLDYIDLAKARSGVPIKY